MLAATIVVSKAIRIIEGSGAYSDDVAAFGEAGGQG
jgi:hypothetical protein